MEEDKTNNPVELQTQRLEGAGIQLSQLLRQIDDEKLASIPNDPNEWSVSQTTRNGTNIIPHWIDKSKLLIPRIKYPSPFGRSLALAFKIYIC